MFAALKMLRTCSIYMRSPLPMHRFLQTERKKKKKEDREKGGKKKRKKGKKNMPTVTRQPTLHQTYPPPATIPDLGGAGRSEQRDPKKAGVPVGPGAEKSWSSVFEH